jgi:predicted Zn-dependent protease
MSMRAAALLITCALATNASANPFTPNLDAQRRSAQALMPVEIALPVPPTAPRSVAVLRIRFYADEDYRAGLFRWADRTRSQLEYLNKVIEPAFGVRFEAESFRRWHRESGNIDIFQMLGELEKMDAGPGVDLVVGYVSPLSLVTTSLHEIGAARLLGHHFVLRGMASVDEAAALKTYDLLDPAEREQIYSRRKWHKETAVFLHEWLHTLGAIHSSNSQYLTNPSYSNHMCTLSPVDTELAAIALKAKLGERETGKIDWSGLRTALAHSHQADWFTKERDDMLALLESQGARLEKAAAKPSAPPPPEGLSSEDVELFNRALELTKANKGDDAWPVGRPLADRYPKNVDVQRMLCRLSYVKAARDEGLEACSRAHDLVPNAPEPLVDAAQARILRKEIPLALATTDEAVALAKKGPERHEIWVWIAELYGQMGLLSRADDALALAGDKTHGRDVAQAALARNRRTFGLPAGAVAADAEPAYAEAFRRIVALIDASKLREARTAVEAARATYPAVPGLEVLSCEIDARQGRLKPAEKACAHALSVMPDLPFAHYLLGHIRMQTGARASAIAAFRKSIELEPHESSPWRSLADLYRMTGEREALASLKTEYQKVFSKPLR